MFKKRFMNPYFDTDEKPGADEPTDEEKKDEKPSFDDILKDPAYQAEFDRRMSKGIDTALNNAEKRLKQIADDTISEAEKLSKMSDLEKKEYQQKKAEKELARRAADLNKRELMAEAKTTLAEQGIPVAFANLLDYSNAETVKPPTEAKNNNSDETEALNKSVYESMKGAF